MLRIIEYEGIAQLGAQATSKTPRASRQLHIAENLVSQGVPDHGGIAQLGERLNGIQEVSGSIPLISTTTDHKAKALWSVLYKRKMRNRVPKQKVTGVFHQKRICDFFAISNVSLINLSSLTGCFDRNCVFRFGDCALFHEKILIPENPPTGS